MNFISVEFCSLVVLTAGINFRWGSIAGLIFFILVLTMGAAVASH
jgi:hypothetical protein